MNRWYYRKCWYKRHLKPYEKRWVCFWIEIERACRFLHRNFIYYGFFKQTKYFFTILKNMIFGVEKYYCVWASDGVYGNKNAVCFFSDYKKMWDYCWQKDIIYFEALRFFKNKRQVVLCYSKT